MFDLLWLEILPLSLCFRIATIGNQNGVRLFVLNSGGVPHKWRCRSKTERVCSQGNIFKVSQEEIKIKKTGTMSDRIETRGILRAWKFKWILVCGSFYSLSNGFHVLSGVRMGSDRHLDEKSTWKHTWVRTHVSPADFSSSFFQSPFPLRIKTFPQFKATNINFFFLFWHYAIHQGSACLHTEMHDL